MTQTQLGRLFDYDNVLGAHIIRASDGRNVAGLDVRNPAYTDYSERDRIAAELVRRWNAFEPGGAVALAVEALRAIIHADALLLGADERDHEITAAIGLADESLAALTALVEGVTR